MINGKRVLAITLARKGSKGIPRKNVSNLCGKPLFLWTVDEVAKSNYIDEHIISTDDERIIDICYLSTNTPKTKAFIRSAKNASDTASSAAAILEVLDQTACTHEYVVELMCTNPLKTHTDIDACIKKLDDTDADSVVSVTRVLDQHPSRVKFIENDILTDFWPEKKESRRQDLTPLAFVRNGAIYAFTQTSFRATGSRYGGIVRPYVMEESVNIDEPIDLLIAQELLKERLSKCASYV